jgi:hypothetical protein
VHHIYVMNTVWSAIIWKVEKNVALFSLVSENLHKFPIKMFCLNFFPTGIWEIFLYMFPYFPSLNHKFTKNSQTRHPANIFPMSNPRLGKIIPIIITIIKIITIIHIKFPIKTYYQFFPCVISNNGKKDSNIFKKKG